MTTENRDADAARQETHYLGDRCDPPHPPPPPPTRPDPGVADRTGDHVTFAFPTDGTLPGWVAVLRFTKRDGSVDWTALDVVYFGDDDDDVFRRWVGDRATRASDFPAPPGGLTVRQMRGIRVGDLQSAARAYLTEAAAEGSLTKGWAREAQRRSGSAGKSHRHYAELAAAWVNLVRTGDRHPNVTLARKLNIAPSTVKNQLDEARARGLLTRAGQGRIGGSLTDQARAELAAKED